MARRGQLDDLTGRRFGRLVVTALAPSRQYRGATAIRWECRCDCGVVVTVHAADLRAKLADGLLPPELAASAPRLIFNDQLNAVMTSTFLVITWIVVFETLRVCLRALRGGPLPPLTEAPYTRSELASP